MSNYMGIPPYPGTPAYTAGRTYNPAAGNPTTSPYTNALFGTVNGTQDALYGSMGVGYPGAGFPTMPASAGIPPYPGTPAYTTGRTYNPAAGNPTTNPYTNALFGTVNGTQDALYSSMGVGYPGVGAPVAPSYMGLPPYPGTPAYTAGQTYNPAAGNLTTNPYTNALFDTVNGTQDALYSSMGVGYPGLGLTA